MQIYLYEEVSNQVWKSIRYLQDMYDVFNEDYFHNSLPDMDVRPLSGSVHTSQMGKCAVVSDPLSDKASVEYIGIKMNYNYPSKEVFESILLHEMCHIYQIYILCNESASQLLDDFASIPDSEGHGVKFNLAANLVNKSPLNKGRYNISRYYIRPSEKREPVDKSGYASIFLYSDGFSLDCYLDTDDNRKMLKKQRGAFIFTFESVDIKLKLNKASSVLNGNHASYKSSLWKEILSCIQSRVLNLSSLTNMNKISYSDAPSKDSMNFLMAINGRYVNESLDYTSVELDVIDDMCDKLEDLGFDTDIDLHNGRKKIYFSLA